MKIEPRDIQVGDRVMRPATVTTVTDKYYGIKYDGAEGAEDEHMVFPEDLAQAEITRPFDPDLALAKHFAGIFDEGEMSVTEALLAAIKAVRAEGK